MNIKIDSIYISQLDVTPLSSKEKEHLINGLKINYTIYHNNREFDGSEILKDKEYIDFIANLQTHILADFIKSLK